MRNGQGIETFNNGEKYVGLYVDDLQNGQVSYQPTEKMIILKHKPMDKV
jgi:hypothetical protein